MKKIEYENFIFETAKAFLTSLYGEFERDNEQKDKPDAAIFIKDNNNQLEVVGIEITSADKSENKHYFNDTRHSRDIENEQLKDCMSGIVPIRPLKRSSISMPRYYIYESIQEKASKYKAYNKDRKYREIILLVSSDYLDLNYNHFDDYLLPWTEHLLSKIKFPFSKAIFVCTRTKDSVVLYDKKKPRLTAPKIDENKELGSTHMQSGFIPVGKVVNLDTLLNSPPLVDDKNPIFQKKTIKKRSINSKKIRNL